MMVSEPELMWKRGENVALDIECDSQLALITLSVIVEGGMTSIENSAPGVAHLTEHLVARHGLVGSTPMTELLSSTGGTIQASTHPFHTEYQISLPCNGFGEQIELSKGATLDLINYWASLHDQQFELGEIEIELGSVDREAEERLSRGRTAIFPWSEMFSLVVPELACSGDLYDVLLGDAVAASQLVHRHLRATEHARIGISVQWPLESSHLTEGLLSLGFAATPKSNETMPPRLGKRMPRAFTIEREIVGLQNSLIADVYCVDEVEPESNERALAVAAVAAELLNNCSGDARWSAGAFGPFGGPDGSTLFRVGRSPLELSELPNSILDAELTPSKKKQLSRLRRITADPYAWGRQSALGIVFGTSLEGLERNVQQCAATDISALIAHIRETESRSLTWQVSS